MCRPGVSLKILNDLSCVVLRKLVDFQGLQLYSYYNRTGGNDDDERPIFEAGLGVNISEAGLVFKQKPLLLSALASAATGPSLTRRKAGGQSALPVIPAPVAIVRVRIIGSVLLTLGLPDYRALADVCLSQLTS